MKNILERVRNFKIVIHWTYALRDVDSWKKAMHEWILSDMRQHRGRPPGYCNHDICRIAEENCERETQDRLLKKNLGIVYI